MVNVFYRAEQMSCNKMVNILAKQWRNHELITKDFFFLPNNLTQQHNILEATFPYTLLYYNCSPKIKLYYIIWMNKSDTDVYNGFCRVSLLWVEVAILRFQRTLKLMAIIKWCHFLKMSCKHFNMRWMKHLLSLRTISIFSNLISKTH